MPPKAFISFEMEDRWARDFLVQQAKDKRNDIEFVDYSVQNPWDNSWKTQCKERIARTKGTIVLIGATHPRVGSGQVGDRGDRATGPLHVRDPDQLRRDPPDPRRPRGAEGHPVGLRTDHQVATPLPGLRPGAVAPSGQLWSRGGG
jgi:hypothetical protein